MKYRIERVPFSVLVADRSAGKHRLASARLRRCPPQHGHHTSEAPAAPAPAGARAHTAAELGGQGCGYDRQVHCERIACADLESCGRRAAAEHGPGVRCNRAKGHGGQRPSRGAADRANLRIQAHRIAQAKESLTEIYGIEEAVRKRIDLDGSDWGKRLHNLMVAVETAVDTEIKSIPTATSISCTS